MLPPRVNPFHLNFEFDGGLWFCWCQFDHCHNGFVWLMRYMGDHWNDIFPFTSINHFLLHKTSLSALRERGSNFLHILGTGFTRSVLCGSDKKHKRCCGGATALSGIIWFQIWFHPRLFLPQITYSYGREVAETNELSRLTVEQ